VKARKVALGAFKDYREFRNAAMRAKKKAVDERVIATMEYRITKWPSNSISI